MIKINLLCHCIIAFFLTCCSLDCIGQTYFNVESTFPCNSCGHYTANLSTLPRYSENQIKTVFDYIANESGIEFRYPQGGCQQRAEMMHILLSRWQHISHARIWIFSPTDIDSTSKIKLTIPDPNGFAPEGLIQWTYHVAPCVLMQRADGKTDTVIIDPALNKNGVMLWRNWLASMGNNNISKYTFLNSEKYFFYTQGNTTQLSGYFYDYASSPDIVTMFDKATVERELAVNDVALFLKGKLEEGYDDSKGEIRKLLGNVTNMVSFFAPQERCNSLAGLTTRQLYTDNGALIGEAMRYYFERVNFWVQKTQSLTLK